MTDTATDLICLEGWRTEKILENNHQLLIIARFVDKTVKCKFCHRDRKFLRRFGRRKREVRDAPIRGYSVIICLSVQRYKCTGCNKVFITDVEEIADEMKATKRLVKYIEEQVIHKTFLQLKKETGANICTIREILVNLSKYLQENYTSSLSDVIGIDEVYINKTARAIITDIRNKQFVELLPRRNCHFIQAFLLEIKDKENIKYVTTDMHRPYKTAVNKILPNARVVIDKFHIQRMGNQAVNKYLAHLRNSFSNSEKKMYMRDRFLLYKRSYKLSEKHKTELTNWSEILPEIGVIYNLKEEFLQIWQAKNKTSAKDKFEEWKNRIPNSLMFAFVDILRAFKNWSEEIFNYFECFVTNAFTESLNSVIKSIVRNSKGCSFDVIRAKLLCRVLILKLQVKKN